MRWMYLDRRRGLETKDGRDRVEHNEFGVLFREQRGQSRLLWRVRRQVSRRRRMESDA